MLSRHRQRGLGLVELFVGLIVGLFVVLAAGAVYLSIFSASSDSTRLVKLNQDMRSIVDIVTFDLHRAGFSGGASNVDFTRRVAPATDIQISADRTCLLYTFDLNLDGIVSSNELFGFRHNEATKQVETLAASVTYPTATTASVADCAALSWQPLNFPNDVVVSSLTFSTEGSRCLRFDPAKFAGVTTGTPAPAVEWVLPSPSYQAACDNPAGIAVSTALTGLAEVRVVKISLTANHARDASLQRTLDETVRVRNDRIN